MASISESRCVDGDDDGGNEYEYGAHARNSQAGTDRRNMRYAQFHNVVFLFPTNVTVQGTRHLVAGTLEPLVYAQHGRETYGVEVPCTWNQPTERKGKVRAKSKGGRATGGLKEAGGEVTGR